MIGWIQKILLGGRLAAGREVTDYLSIYPFEEKAGATIKARGGDATVFVKLTETELENLKHQVEDILAHKGAKKND